MSCVKNLSLSSVCLRIASLGLLVVFLFHVIGYGLPRWLTIQITVSEFNFKGTYHMGLWQDCSCTPGCYCVGKQTFKGWQRTVQALHTLGLVGFTISGIFCIFVLFCSPQNVKIRRVNVGLLLCSGICTLIGVIVFATERSGEYDDLVRYLDAGAVTETYMNSAFILSVIAAALCLLLCVPLFLLDLRSISTAAQQDA